jgi:hypothetical protein
MDANGTKLSAVPLACPSCDAFLLTALAGLGKHASPVQTLRI